MNLVKFIRISPRWCACRMFQRKNIVTSLDKNGPREEWPEVLRGYIEYISVKECNSGNVPVCALYLVNPAVMFQDRNWFLDRKVRVNQERFVIRFQRRSTTVYPGSNVFKLQQKPKMKYMKMWSCLGKKKVCRK